MHVLKAVFDSNGRQSAFQTGPARRRLADRIVITGPVSALPEIDGDRALFRARQKPTLDRYPLPPGKSRKADTRPVSALPARSTVTARASVRAANNPFSAWSRQLHLGRAVAIFILN